MGNEMRGQFFGLALIPAAVLALIGIVGVIIMIIGMRRWWRKQESVDVGTLVTADDITSNDGNEKEEMSVRDAVDLPKHMWTAKLLRVFIYLLVAAFAWLLCGLVWFDYLPIGAGIPITTIFLWICWFFILPYHDDVPLVEAVNSFSLANAKIWFLHKVGVAYRKIKSRPYLFFIGCVVQFILIFIACFFGEGMCVLDQPMAVSTRFMRRNNPPTCAGPTPCHIYLTYSEDPTTSIFINFHIAGTLLSSGQVYYDTTSHAASTSMSDYAYNQSSVALGPEYYELQRTIHYAHLTGLTPGTTYYFRAGRGSDLSKEKSFRTPPLTSPYNFASGGDMGVSDIMKNLSILAAREDPLFVTVGGDLSYADGMFTCYPRWDQWLDIWESVMVDTAGRYIPMILSLGNHEAGGYEAPPEDIPFYSQWFPQNGDGTQKNRKTYHYHQFGSEMAFIVLDSAINLAPSDPGQMAFLESALALPVSKRFTTYHVPLYPSVRSYDGSINIEERENWGPLFDKYNLTISFENHDHYYKRTKRMVNSVEDPHGTTYIGDGCWGAVARQGSGDPTRFYLEKIEATEHYLRVDITSNSTTVSATNLNGTVFDQTTV